MLAGGAPASGVYLSQYPDDASAWFRLGHAYQMSLRREECIEAYWRMLEIEPSNASAYIGEVELASGHSGAAIEALQLAERTGSTTAVEPLARANPRSGDLERALGKYQERLDLQPLGGEWQDAWLLAHSEIGRLYEQKGQPAEAAKYYQRLFDIWKDVDQDLPPLLDARRSLARVTDAANATKVK